MSFGVFVYCLHLLCFFVFDFLLLVWICIVCFLVCRCFGRLFWCGCVSSVFGLSLCWACFVLVWFCIVCILVCYSELERELSTPVLSKLKKREPSCDDTLFFVRFSIRDSVAKQGRMFISRPTAMQASCSGLPVRDMNLSMPFVFHFLHAVSPLPFSFFFVRCCEHVLFFWDRSHHQC